MEIYVTEWLNLITRFAHLVSGIAWIGASFYFIWLDNHLQKPSPEKDGQGIAGDLWAIHGGGFYEVAKYKLAPPTIPTTLHWFKWEAYTTWITGFLLLSLMFYVDAHSYLIDKRVAELTQWQAIGLGIGSIVVGTAIYEIMVRTPLKKHSAILGGILIILVTILAFGLTQFFSARGAYMHVAAIIGTVMAGNVFFGIIPAQKALVRAVEAGTRPDPKYGHNAKLRSTHNTYATLPILFIMISNHYPMTYNHSLNWLVLVAIIFITATIRQYFVLRHFGKQKIALLAIPILLTVLLAYLIIPASITETAKPTTQPIDDSQVQAIINIRCVNCHSSSPIDDSFKIAPSGVILDDMNSILQWAPRIKARVIDSQDMPLMNKTNMTAEERQYLKVWFNQLSSMKREITQ